MSIASLPDTTSPQLGAFTPDLSVPLYVFPEGKNVLDFLKTKNGNPEGLEEAISEPEKYQLNSETVLQPTAIPDSPSFTAFLESKKTKIRAALDNPKTSQDVLENPNKYFPELNNPLPFKSGLPASQAAYRPEYHPHISGQGEKELFILFESLSEEEEINLVRTQTKKGNYQYARFHMLRHLKLSDQKLSIEGIEAATAEESHTINQARNLQKLNLVIHGETLPSAPKRKKFQGKITHLREYFTKIMKYSEGEQLAIMRSFYQDFRSVDPFKNNPTLALALTNSTDQASALVAGIKRGVSIIGAIDLNLESTDPEERELNHKLQDLIESRLDDFIPTNHQSRDNLITCLKSHPVTPGEFSLLARAEMGTMNLAKYAPDVETFIAWEERLGEIDQDTRISFTHDFLAPLERAGWIETEKDVEMMFKLLESQENEKRKFIAYYLVNATPNKNWQLAEDVIAKRVLPYFWYLERWARLDANGRKQWTADDSLLLNTSADYQSPDMFETEMHSFHDILPNIEDMSDFEIRFFREFSDQFSDKENTNPLSARENFKFVKHLIDTGEFNKVIEFVREYGFFHLQAFLNHYEGQMPTGFKEFADMRKSILQEDPESSIKKTVFIEAAWEKLTHKKLTPEQQETFLKTIKDLAQFTDGAGDYFEEIFIDFFSKLTAKHFLIMSDFDPDSTLKILANNKHKIPDREIMRYIMTLKKDDSPKKRQAISDGIALFHHLTKEEKFKVNKENDSVEKQFAHLYQAYLEVFPGKENTEKEFIDLYKEKLQFLPILWPETAIPYFVKQLFNKTNFSKEDILDFQELFPGSKTLIVSTRLLVEYLRSSSEEKVNFKKQFKLFPLLSKACAESSEDPLQTHENIIKFLREENHDFNNADIKALLEVFPKTAIHFELLAKYLRLDPGSRETFLDRAKQEKIALVQRVDNIIGLNDKSVTAAILGVIDRVSFQSFLEGVAKAKTEAITALPEAFSTEYRITVQAFEPTDLNQGEVDLIQRIINKDVGKSLAKKAFPDIDRDIKEAIDNALKHMKAKGFTSSQNYEALQKCRESRKRLEGDLSEAIGGNTLPQSITARDEAIRRNTLLQLVTTQKMSTPIVAPHLYRLILHQVFNQQEHLRSGLTSQIEDVKSLLKAGDISEGLIIGKYLPLLQELFQETDYFCNNLVSSITIEDIEWLRVSFPEISSDSFISEIGAAVQDLVASYFKREIVDSAFDRQRKVTENQDFIIQGAPKNEIDYFYAKDTCMAKHTEEINNPQFIPLRIYNADKTDIFGFIWCLEEEHSELGKTLILSDVHPNLGVRGTFNSQQMYDQVLEAIEAYANAGGYKAIVQTKNETAQSNDVRLGQHIRSAIAGKPEVKLETITTFPRMSNDDISTCALITKL